MDMRYLLAAVAAALALPALAACGNTDGAAAPGAEELAEAVYPPLPDDPESLLQCDKGAPVISTRPDYAEATGKEEPNDFMDAARAYAAFGIRPEFGDKFEVAGMSEKGDYAVLTLAAAETVKDSVAQGNTAAVVTVGATNGVWAVTSSAACSRFVGGDK